MNKIKLNKLLLKCWQSLSNDDLDDLNKEQRNQEVSGSRGNSSAISHEERLKEKKEERDDLK